VGGRKAPGYSFRTREQLLQDALTISKQSTLSNVFLFHQPDIPSAVSADPPCRVGPNCHDSASAQRLSQPSMMRPDPGLEEPAQPPGSAMRLTRQTDRQTDRHQTDSIASASHRIATDQHQIVQTDRQTDRQTDSASRQTDRDRQTDRQASATDGDQHRDHVAHR
jgi:hypothetical protein